MPILPIFHFFLKLNLDQERVNTVKGKSSFLVLMRAGLATRSMFVKIHTIVQVKGFWDPLGEFTRQKSEILI